jgi:Fic family protein
VILSYAKIGTIMESLALIEPLLPGLGNRILTDLATQLWAESSALNSNLHLATILGIGDLVRTMNCYYSNLIEGHRTHPIDIERALAQDFSTDPQQRELQLEAKAHIEVQRAIDLGNIPVEVVSGEYLQWIHREFCTRLPAEMLVLSNTDGSKQIQVVPGEWRTGEIIVGRHIPISAPAIDRFITRFVTGYRLERLSQVDQVIAVAAAHHRLVWIHPFSDGNGRVARLFSHAMLREIGIGTSLWSISRGLARSRDQYRDVLANADLPRWNDLDGRGNLTTKGLQAFCEFFLNTCIDQVQFMRSCLDPQQLLARIEVYLGEEIVAKRLLPGSDRVVAAVFRSGELARGQAAAASGYQERQGRKVLQRLLATGLLIADTPKGAVRVGFPSTLLERYFPRLFLG